MATSTASLTTINVFPTEALYTSNKGSIGAAEISLVKDTGSTYTTDDIINTVVNDKATLLYTGRINKGDINLSQSYRGFKYLVIAMSHDNGSNRWLWVVSTTALYYPLQGTTNIFYPSSSSYPNSATDLANTPGVLWPGMWRWEVFTYQGGTTNTLFKHSSDDNAHIWTIWGIK